MKLKMTISEALEFADEWSRGLTLHEGSQGWRVVCMLLAEEVRRLAQVEAEHAALLKAISDAIPVFWYRPVMNGDMYEGPHHNNSFVGRLQRAEKPSEWLPLYTLNGIKKP